MSRAYHRWTAPELAELRREMGAGKTPRQAAFDMGLELASVRQAIRYYKVEVRTRGMRNTMWRRRRTVAVPPMVGHHR